jgi:type IV pilus assembly protein PilC
MERHYLITLSRTLSTTLSGGIPLVPALGMVAEALSNQAWSSKVQEVSGRVQEGVSLAHSLTQSGTFPKMSLEMIDVGENSGSLVEMLGEVADFHEDELDLYLGRVTTWVEPVMLLVMGVIVAIIVISMYLPIFYLAGTIQ